MKGKYFFKAFLHGNQNPAFISCKVKYFRPVMNKFPHLIIVLYYLVPFGILLVYVLALAGLASMMILVSNLLHMYTERRQRIHQKEKYPDHL